ncbi:3-hydroxyisobutyrate dehydrogenase-like beta-hydroxyacid dehydrogenase [Bacillus velezensis]|nr:3-hydroxyisobutyrate dehydrogenase-like beta-hydroxyacid dehydrogenase [Bacillus velezensis]MDF9780728.1 3-hydroxyisobutyrate dehydrogenase-like beta-hydroxyacid dehydrogenase [Bacillus velezensis]
MKIAIVGLGNMGRPIAENIMKAGYSLTVYNRTKEKRLTCWIKGQNMPKRPDRQLNMRTSCCPCCQTMTP